MGVPCLISSLTKNNYRKKIWNPFDNNFSLKYVVFFIKIKKIKKIKHLIKYQFLEAIVKAFMHSFVDKMV